MKIVSLQVENFRAIDRVELEGLKDMVVIAGPNGCGKSCVLDAIRLFKSVYGGYQPNEWHQWLNEFQINPRNLHQMASLLRDPSRRSLIEAHIELDEEERAFIREELEQILADLAWKQVGQSRAYSGNALATDLRAFLPQVQQIVSELRPEVLDHLNHRRLRGELEIRIDGTAGITRNLLLEIVFSMFAPGRLGVIDYHGAHRNYGREALGGINLNLDQEEERLKTTSLYNAANKYSNIKSEMAAEYVKQGLRERSLGEEATEQPSRRLTETLQSLFAAFFPGKTFFGPVPTNDGNLEFPVQVGEDGPKHDINDLSSGEKEILFGYLRLSNSAPKHSVVLLDEPELHLNPALIRGLPQFYHEHVGKALNNQLWLVTHSDAFLREAIGHEGIQVFHMRHAGASETVVNQAHELRPGEEVESTILDMVGNLATYSPGGKVVFFEGEDSEFDLRMVSRLFPTIENEVNLISGGNRARVEALHKVLERSIEAGHLPIRVYSVVDKDTGPEIRPASGDLQRHFSWDVYHIENYLLESKFIDGALGRINVSHIDVSSLGKIDERLKQIAEGQVGELVSHRVRSEINGELISSLSLSTNPQSEDIGADLFEAVEKSANRIKDQLGGPSVSTKYEIRLRRNGKPSKKHYPQKTGRSTSVGGTSCEDLLVST